MYVWYIFVCAYIIKNPWKSHKIRTKVRVHVPSVLSMHAANICASPSVQYMSHKMLTACSGMNKIERQFPRLHVLSHSSVPHAAYCKRSSAIHSALHPSRASKAFLILSRVLNGCNPNINQCLLACLTNPWSVLCSLSPPLCIVNTRTNKAFNISFANFPTRFIFVYCRFLFKMKAFIFGVFLILGIIGSTAAIECYTCIYVVTGGAVADPDASETCYVSTYFYTNSSTCTVCT